jgi:hypothetical protein
MNTYFAGDAVAGFFGSRLIPFSKVIVQGLLFLKVLPASPDFDDNDPRPLGLGQ